jgi:hypothetical protein
LAFSLRVLHFIQYNFSRALISCNNAKTRRMVTFGCAGKHGHWGQPVSHSLTIVVRVPHLTTCYQQFTHSARVPRASGAGARGVAGDWQQLSCWKPRPQQAGVRRRNALPTAMRRRRDGIAASESSAPLRRNGSLFALALVGQSGPRLTACFRIIQPAVVELGIRSVHVHRSNVGWGSRRCGEAVLLRACAVRLDGIRAHEHRSHSLRPAAFLRLRFLQFVPDYQQTIVR